MKKILLAVDDTRSSIRTCEILLELLEGCLPEKLILLYVEKIEGASLMDDLLLSDSELETLKESLQGTEYQEDLDKRADRILAHFSGFFSEHGVSGVDCVVRQGHPAEEIMAVAAAEQVDLIAMGTRSRRLHNIFMGSVSREVANQARMPVLLLR